jgi:hypothetical protein
MSMPPYDARTYGLVPPKRRKRWPWVVLALVLVVGSCLGGGALLLGGTAAVVNEGVKAVESEAAARTDDVKMTKCARDQFGLVTVSYTVVNSGTEARSYLPQFDIVAADKTVIGQAADITQDIAPGATLKGKATGSVSEDSGKITCRLASA